MRTTVDLPDELMRSAKKKAAEENAMGKMLVPESILESRDELYDFMDGIG